MERLDHVEDRPVVLHDLTFGDFENQPIGRHAGFGQARGHRVGEVSVIEVADRHVDRDRQTGPIGNRGERLLEHGMGEIGDEPRDLTQLDELIRPEQPETVVLPAGQRLHLMDASAAKVDLGLVPDPQAAIEKVTELTHQGEAVERMSIVISHIEPVGHT